MLNYSFSHLLAFAGVLAFCGSGSLQASLPTWGLTSSGQIVPIAGNGSQGSTGDGGQATAAELFLPHGIAVDAAGNVYIADTENNKVRKVNGATGIITTIAGTGTGGYGGDHGQAVDAQLYGPVGVALDSNGNIYIAENGNCTIRVISAATGVITTFAGNGTLGYGGDGQLAVNAELAAPNGIAIDANNNVYIADSGNNRIRKVSAQTLVISTVAGNGTAGYLGDGALATAAELNAPRGVAVDKNGNIYIADTYNNLVRMVNPASGIITPFAGGGPSGYPIDEEPATLEYLDQPISVATDAAGDVYIGESGHGVVDKVPAGTGIIRVIAGGSAWVTGVNTPANQQRLFEPAGVAVDSAGDVLISDYFLNRVYFALNTGQTQVAQSISFPSISGKTLGTTPFTLSVTSSSNLPVTLVSSTPSVCTVSGSTVTLQALGLCSIASFQDGSTTYAAATPVTGSFYVTPNWGTSSSQQIITIAGTGTPGSNGDTQLATSAQLNHPDRIAVDHFGNVYIADTGNNRIRRVDSVTAKISTFAGTGTAGYNGDNIAATAAELNSPEGVSVDSSGNVYIADTNNQRIREVVAATGNIITVAGNGTPGYSGDNNPAVSAELWKPIDVEVDRNGNLFIADYDNSAIREVTASTGIITTFVLTDASGGIAIDSEGNVYTSGFSNEITQFNAAGTPTVVAGRGVALYGGDGALATSAYLNGPLGVAVDSDGDLFIADTSNSRARGVNVSTGIINTVAGTSVAGFNGDGAASTAELNTPVGVAVDGAGNLYIADTFSHRIRFVRNPLGLNAQTAPSAPSLSSPSNGASGVSLATMLSWGAASGAVTYDIYFGTSSTPGYATTMTGTSYNPGTLTFGTTYYWSVTAKNSAGSASSPVFSFTAISQSSCTYSFPNGSTVSIPADASQYSIQVNVNVSACPWNASSDQGWLALNNANSSGSGTLTYNVTANNTGVDRTSHVSVGSQSVTVSQAFTSVQFNDVSPSDGYFDAVNLMLATGVTTGCVVSNSPSTRSFCPDDNVTREEMAAFIVRAVTGATTPTIYNHTPYFTDVPATDPFFADVQKFADLGITAGCAPNLFCPNDTIPRWEMAIFMVRARLLLYGASFSYNPAPYFVDAPTNVEGNGTAFPFIQRSYDEHITAGCATSPLQYCPDEIVTRWQMASFIMRSLFNEVTALPANAPLLAGVSPNAMAATPGTQLTVTITGVNTHFTSGDTVTVPSGMLTVSNVMVNSATSITVTLTAAANVVAGPQALVVTTGGQNLTLPLAIRVGTY